MKIKNTSWNLGRVGRVGWELGAGRQGSVAFAAVSGWWAVAVKGGVAEVVVDPCHYRAKILGLGKVGIACVFACEGRREAEESKGSV